MLNIFVDGGARNNQNPEKREGYGSLKVFHNDKPVEITVDGEKYSQLYLSWQSDTNNLAEYKSFIVALTYAADLLKRLSHAQKQELGEIVVKSDSRLVIDQVRGDAKVKNADLRPLCDQARSLLTNYPISIEWVDGETMKSVLGH